MNRNSQLLALNCDTGSSWQEWANQRKSSVMTQLCISKSEPITFGMALAAGGGHQHGQFPPSYARSIAIDNPD